jgi:uncharacterized protein (TIGR00255 family)
MIQSMTGFGRAELAQAGWRCAVELRSVNSRFLDFRVKLPPGLNHLEEACKKVLRTGCERGKIDGTVTLTPDEGGGPPIKVNRPLLRRYAAVLDEVREVLGAPVQLTLGDLMGSRDALLTNAWEDQREAMEQLVEAAFARCVESLRVMRRQEGVALGKELLGRTALLRQHLTAIAPLARDLPAVYARRLRENLARLMEGADADRPTQERIAQEIALFAERCDVSEELSRFGTHLDHLEDMLRQGGALGRKIEFLLQELNREANTLSVKSSDVQVSTLVIEVKSELEKLREQCQNIE